MELCHKAITTLAVTSEERILHGINTLTVTLMDAPTSQSYYQRQAIEYLLDASNSWEASNERTDPAVQIPRPTPVHTRRAMKILERNLKQTHITHQPTIRVTNKLASCEPDPRRTTQQYAPEPSTRVKPKETPQAVQLIEKHTRSHTQNTQPTIALFTRAH